MASEASEDDYDIRKLILSDVAVFETVIEWNYQLDFIHDTKWALKITSSKQNTKPIPSDIPNELNLFKPGMRIEAIDRVYPQYVCVASILRVIGDNVLVFFDGWSNAYNYWCRYDSPEIRPAGTAQKLNMPLCPPSSTTPGSNSNLEWRKGGSEWKGYLEVKGAIAAPDHIFGKLVIPEGSDKYSDLAEKKDPKSIVTENGMLPLFENCGRIVMREKINFSKCPVKIRDRLKTARRCIVCGGPFLVGFHGILPWTSIEWIRSKPFSRMSILCSVKCAENFTIYNFPFNDDKQQTELSNRRYYNFHRTFYNSERRDLKIQNSHAESKGFRY
ncbi:Lethal(3)malignant brain tumor-like protein 3 [Oopsacas minuta]|uniref:Lethal(3)malignant brain tumor-like protein 3 n=1 Tax=Oopsacas minuta TaxID=111878 RepID=A0AAV7JGS9_9METZ|nr:Lethal(3)malignant brain tumor-like protein 3 [Oopsacas minuta]